MKRLFSKLEQTATVVWKIDLSDLRFHRGNWQKILSSEEIEKANSFHFPEDCRRFIAAHYALRLILSDYSEQEPQNLKFATNDFGKPFLVDSDLKFNLSHSNELALVAVANGGEIGVDVESFDKKIEHAESITQIFSPEEAAFFKNCEQTSANKEFFRLWTRKEAFVKAKGEGLSTPLHSFSVINGGVIEKRFSVKQKNEAQILWRGWDLEPEENYIGALVVNSQNQTEPLMKNFNSLYLKSL